MMMKSIPYAFSGILKRKEIIMDDYHIQVIHLSSQGAR